MDVYGYQACVVKYGIEVDWFFFSLLCNLSFRVGLSKNASVHLPLVIWDLTGLHMVQSIQLATQSSLSNQIMLPSSTSLPTRTGCWQCKFSRQRQRFSL